MGEFVVLYGIVGVIRMERSWQEKKKYRTMQMENGENTL